MSFLTLKGRCAIVTGAAQGIGYHTARMMCENGMKTAIVDLNEEKLRETAKELNALGGAEVFAAGCDVSSLEAIEKAITIIAERFGGIDVLVNGAGILNATKIPDIPLDEWEKILKVNLTGSFFMMQKALPYLEKSAHPRVINIASVGGRMGGVGNSMSYAASKGGMIAITR
jgi:3-oxoacyl-[acyl-carrier protein] reductase